MCKVSINSSQLIHFPSFVFSWFQMSHPSPNIVFSAHLTYMISRENMTGQTSLEPLWNFFLLLSLQRKMKAMAVYIYRNTPLCCPLSDQCPKIQTMPNSLLWIICHARPNSVKDSRLSVRNFLIAFW